MQFNIPFRIVFTANSFEMVTSLIGDRPLTGSDLEAFTERISVMICDSKPADYLDSRGAMRFTKEDRKGSWIGGEKRLARHLIRNYQLHFEESEFIRDGRMLVAGRSSDALTVPFDLSGYGSELVDLLVDYLDKLVAGNASTVITGSLHMNNDGRVFVRTIPLLRNLCKTRNATRPAFSKALDRFLTGKKMRIQSGELAELDLRKLHICGASAGLNVDSVAGLVKRQVGHA